MSIKFANLKSTTIGMDDVLDFGSWRGHTVEEVIKLKPSYIQHLVDNSDKYQKYFYESVMEALELAKYTQKSYNNAYHVGRLDYDQRGLSDMDDWFDDIPF